MKEGYGKWTLERKKKATLILKLLKVLVRKKLTAKPCMTYIQGLCVVTRKINLTYVASGSARKISIDIISKSDIYYTFRESLYFTRSISFQ